MVINRLKFLCFLITILILTSCTNSKLRTSIVPAYQLQDVKYFPVTSYITYIKKGNRGEINDEISEQSEKLTEAILKSNALLYKVTGRIDYKFTDDKFIANDAIWSLIEEVEFKNRITSIELPATLRLMMNENNTRFAMAILVDGFVRKKGNYTGQVLLSIGVGILTFGYIIPPLPPKSNSTLRIIILDAERNEIAFYRRNVREDKSPLDPRVIEKQFNKIFKGYFY